MGFLDSIMNFFDELDKKKKINRARWEIENAIRMKERDIQIKIEKYERNVKLEILNRFKKRQLDAIASVRGLPKMKTKKELVSVLVEEMTLDELLKFAKNYKIKYRDLTSAFEKYKKNLEYELEMFKRDRWLEFEEYKREILNEDTT